jgi:hypothetical protein
MNKPRDPPFRHPSSASGYAPSLRTAEAGEYEEEEEDEDEEPFSYPGERRSVVGGSAPQLPPLRAQSGMGLAGSPFGDEYRAQGGRVGGFTSPPPPVAIAPPPGSGTPGVSRTMQYADPYAAIKANLASNTTPSGGNDYPYTGYR